MKNSELGHLLSRRLLDPQFAVSYIAGSIEDAVYAGEIEIFRTAVGDVAKARGISTITKITEQSEGNLLKMISDGGKPCFRNMKWILEECGIQEMAG